MIARTLYLSQFRLMWGFCPGRNGERTLPMLTSSGTRIVFVSSYLYVCVLIPLYFCPHTSVRVLIPLYMCPHTSIYVSWCLYSKFWSRSCSFRETTPAMMITCFTSHPWVCNVLSRVDLMTLSWSCYISSVPNMTQPLGSFLRCECPRDPELYFKYRALNTERCKYWREETDKRSDYCPHTLVA